MTERKDSDWRPRLFTLDDQTDKLQFTYKITKEVLMAAFVEVSNASIRFAIVQTDRSILAGSSYRLRPVYLLIDYSASSF